MDSLPQKLLLLALAGALGTLARFGLASAAQRLLGGAFPWGTLAVNVVGCFAFGLVWSLADSRLNMAPQTRLILLVGFLGAFTTFSTFAFESTQLMQARQWLGMFSHLAAHNALGIAAVFAGFALGRLA